MVSEDEIVAQFSDLGVSVTDQKIIEKCIDLCITYNLSEEDLVNAWMAFSITNLDGADPTSATLVQMERKDLVKTEIKTPRRPTKFAGSATKSAKMLIYDPADHAKTSGSANSDELMDTYQHQNCETPKAKTGQVHRADSGAFSPIGYSPKVANTSERYESRSNAGDVLLSFGPSRGPTGADTRGRHVPVVTAMRPWPEDWRYMFDCNLLLDEAVAHDDQLEYLAGQICYHGNLPGVEELESNALPFQEPVLMFGRVVNAETGAMTSQSVLLESALKFGGALTALSLAKLPTYSLFPGQAVVVRGANPTGRLILADEVHAAAPLPLPPRLPSLSENTGPLTVVVAAGPFTPLDTLNYRPLEDLMAYVTEKRPHVLVLVGPFVDAQHPLVREGLLAEPVAEFFEKRFVKVAETALKAQTQLVLVSSSREAGHHPVYPTPPYRLPRWPASVLRLPDPAMFDVDGVHFAVAATDVLKHLASQEMSFASAAHRKAHGHGNRVHRLARHLLSQQTLYPLAPPPLDVGIDVGLLRAHGHLEATPHVLVLPSDMRFFATEADGCVMVNPERLSKGLIGGTFARFDIPPPAPDSEPQTFHRQVGVRIMQI